MAEKKASCTEDGNIEYWVCSCGALFRDSKGSQPITRDKTVLTAKGHTPGDAMRENAVEATASADGSYDEVVYCKVCGEELSREKQIIPSTGPVLTGTVKGNELTYSIANLPEGARLIAARFDGGRLTAVKVVNDPGATGKVDLNGSGNAYKLFLLSSDSIPLCPAWSS